MNSENNAIYFMLIRQSDTNLITIAEVKYFDTLEDWNFVKDENLNPYIYSDKEEAIKIINYAFNKSKIHPECINNEI